jgi:hypothetical protein
VPVPCDLVATDACEEEKSRDVSASSRIVPSSGSCSDAYTQINTWSTADWCGNPVSDEQTVVVVDTTPPTFRGTPQETITVTCVEHKPEFTLEASDNCDTDVAVEYTESSPTQSGYVKTFVRTWLATDNCGNTATTMQTVIVHDTVDPTVVGPEPPPTRHLTCRDALVVANYSGQDNCGGPVTVLNETQPEWCAQGGLTGKNGLMFVEWQLKDESNNGIALRQTIMVADNENPEFQGPLPIDETVEWSEDYTFPEPPLIATDDCTPDQIIIPTISTVDVLCDHNYTIVQRWDVQDCHGNPASHTRSITVIDTTAPDAGEYGSDETTCYPLDDLLDNEAREEVFSDTG